MSAVLDKPTARAKAAPAAAAPPPAELPAVDVASLVAENKKLRDTVEYMDQLSQLGTTKMSALVRVALAWIEANHMRGDFDTIETVLNMIWFESDDLSNNNNCQAEEVGCNYRDPDRARRHKEVDKARALGLL